MEKKLRKNYIYNLAYQVLTVLLPIITTPYVSRVIGAQGVGIYSYTLSIATYFILFGSLGISLYGQREIAYLRDNIQKRNKIFFEIIILRLITMIISIIIFYFCFVKKGDYHTYYHILILELFATIFDISWFFQGLEEFDKTVLRQLITKIISVLCIFIFVKDKNDLSIYILIYVLSTLIGNLSLWLYLPKYIKKIEFKELHVFKHLKPTLALFVPQVAMQIYLVVDKTMIGNILKDMSEVGNYEQSQKIIRIALTIVTALGTVVAPRIANLMSKKDSKNISDILLNSFEFVWFLGIPIMFGIMGVSSTLVPWFLGKGYKKSIKIMIFGSPLVLAIGLNNVTGIQYLLPAKKQNLYTKSVIIGAIINFTLNFILISKYKALGAIVASVVAEISIFLIQLFYTKEIINIKYLFKNSYKNFIAGFIMLLVICYIGHIFPPTIITTFMQILIGIIVYMIILYVEKDKIVYNIINFIMRKIKRS